MGQYRCLTDEHVQSFLNKGYLIVKDFLDMSLANPWIAHAYERLGYNRDDESTWAQEIVWMHREYEIPIREAAPKAWDAIRDVVGGQERLETNWALNIPGSRPRPKCRPGTRTADTSDTFSIAPSKAC